MTNLYHLKAGWHACCSYQNVSRPSARLRVGNHTLREEKLNRFAKMLGSCIAAMTLVCTAAEAQEKVTFATASTSLSYVTYYATLDMGFFKKVGLEPELNLVGSGAKAMAAAVGGDVDVIMPSPAEVMKARTKGIPLITFGAVATQLGTSVVFSKDWAAKHHITANSTLEEREAALKGIRLAVSSSGSLTDAVARYFALRGGLNPDRDMTLVGIPNQSGAMMIAMDRGRVDGFVIAPPDTNIAAKKLGAIIAFNPPSGNIPDLAGFFHIGLAGNEKFVRSEKAEKVARAFQMTLDAINDPARTNIVRDRVHAAHYSNVDPEIFAQVWEYVVAAVPDTLKMNDGMFEKLTDLYKLVDPEFNRGMIAGSYTNEVADKVAP